MTNASYNLKNLPGKHANTTLLSHDNEGYSFLVEIIDKNLYEFTICMYDTEETMNRHEYVLTCSKRSLRDLYECIKVVLE